MKIAYQRRGGRIPGEVSPSALMKTQEFTVSRITPSRGWVPINIRELWDYRELLYFFLRRDISVRYKQTALGIAWAVLQPLLAMAIFSVFFGRLAKFPSDGIPYPVFAYAALIPWTFFANGLNQGANSLIANPNLIGKVYFPRLTLPISAVLGGLVDFTLSFLLLLSMMVYYDISVGVRILFTPIFLLLALVSSLALSLWLSAMNVRYRDVRYVIPFLTQVWLFATPVAYSSSLVPPQWRWLFGLNPMVGVIEGFRWALLGTNTSPWPSAAIAAGMASGILFGGALFFRKMERTFADVV